MPKKELLKKTDDKFQGHHPVMLHEMLNYLNPQDNKSYLDCTFGAGGYSQAILSQANCGVTAFDQDISVKKFANHLKSDFPDRFNFIEANFQQVREKLPLQKFDGVILDLGVSSMQLDQAERGFSFLRDGPLDMRMGNETINAEYIINNYSEEKLADIIYHYGQEVQARSIAKNIVKRRSCQNINTTLKLATIVREAMHYRKGKIDPATKTFQAIRILVNDELTALRSLLASAQNILNKQGRLIIVSFHSLEDVIVKNFFKQHMVKKLARSKYSKEQVTTKAGEWLQVITKKPISPTREEIVDNPRSRSAKMRVAEKIETDHD